MDMEEVQKWILPTDYDHTEAEAKHLVMFSFYYQSCLRYTKIFRNFCSLIANYTLVIFFCILHSKKLNDKCNFSRKYSFCPVAHVQRIYFFNI